MMSESGLAESTEMAYRSTVFGTISYYRAFHPAMGSAERAAWQPTVG